jgi:pimeloyl-ACP methyl ester carboxylesterase
MAATARVRIDDLEMEYEEAGRGARPFVLVHGFTGSRDDWSRVLEDLAREGRTVTPDQRGHGSSGGRGDPARYTLERLVADLAGFLDALGIERCDLLGHSMGGMVTLRFALAHPERVTSLVLMDTAAGPIGGIPEAARKAGAKIAREQGMEVLHTLMRARAENDPNVPPSMKRLAEAEGAEVYFERTRRKMLAMDPEAFATLAAVLSEQEGILDRLGAIRRPTTVLVGAEDLPFLEPSEQMAKAIPGARHVVIPDAAHSPQVENREAWLAAIRAHLAWVRSA